MPAVELRGVTKTFQRHSQKPFSTSLKSYLLYDLWHKKDRSRPRIQALRDINLKIEKGESYGIIGRNGSGKSTMLKLVGGILKPDNGEVLVEGKVAALIELGAGFHPELSGRENITINGTILGLSREEIQSIYDEIVDFAELQEYIDDPVRTYSSGMFMRLGFSIAIHVVPDILIIDEILAVGDEDFQNKCHARMRKLRKDGKTIILVSHNPGAIEQMCDKVCLLDNGKLLKEGNPVTLLSSYHRLIYEGDSGPEEGVAAADSQGREESRWGTRKAEITRVSFIDPGGGQKSVFSTGDEFIARIDFEAHEPIKNPVFGIAIHKEDGAHINGPNTKLAGYPIKSIEGRGSIEYRIPALNLMPGRYYFTAVIYDHDCLVAHDHWERCFQFKVVESERIGERHGSFYLPSAWRLIE